MLLTWASSQGANALLNSAEFIAGLTVSTVQERGTGSATFTRATTATVEDHEGIIRRVLSGEVRFQGIKVTFGWTMRRFRLADMLAGQSGSSQILEYRKHLA